MEKNNRINPVNLMQFLLGESTGHSKFNKGLFSILKYLQIENLIQLKSVCSFFKNQINDLIIRQYIKVVGFKGMDINNIWEKYSNLSE